MARVASKPRKRPGLTRRMARSTCGRHARHRRDGGPQDRRRGQDQRRPGDRAGGSDGSQGLGAAAGGGPSAGHQTDPRAVASDDRGRGADTPQEIPAKG